ncbi:MAG: LysE family translocator [Neomegalonema sp.]|nr:LysE family translocator [Neomegalonema sp.]
MSDLLDPERLIALVSLAMTTLWTPGPNNIMLANSGASFGMRRTLPHAWGVALGFALMFFLVALGLGEIFERYPLVREALRWAGFALMLYLAWRIATAGRSKDAATRARPFRFHEAVAFQWINPKAWTMCITTAALFVTGTAPTREALLCAGVFALIGLTSSHGWTAFGAGIRRFLSSPERLRLFNGVMGALIAACAVLLVLE